MKEESRQVYNFIESLSEEEVQEIIQLIRVPDRIAKETRGETAELIFALRDEWDEFDANEFPEALSAIEREDLAEIANRVSWLSSTSKQNTYTRVRRFVNLLRDEISMSKWKFIIRTELNKKVDSNITFETAFKQIVESGAIEPNLSYMCQLMELVNRNDIAKKVAEYRSTFQNMNKQEIKSRLKYEITHYSRDRTLYTKIRGYLLYIQIRIIELLKSTIQL